MCIDICLQYVSRFYLFYLLVSILFFFGFGFVGALTLYMVVWLAAYFLVFKVLLYKKNKAVILQQ
jgi:hypothetical protein